MEENKAEFKMSESIAEISKAMGGFSTEVGKIAKDANNPFFKSKYASLSSILDAIAEPLAKNKLSINQFPLGSNGMVTILAHQSGEYMMSTFYMTPKDNSPQSYGSVITYQRRYALGAILGLNIDEDDDGNKASFKAATKENVKSTMKSKPVEVKGKVEQGVKTNYSVALLALLKTRMNNMKPTKAEIIEYLGEYGIEFDNPEEKTSDEEAERIYMRLSKIKS